MNKPEMLPCRDAFETWYRGKYANDPKDYNGNLWLAWQVAWSTRPDPAQGKVGPTDLIKAIEARKLFPADKIENPRTWGHNMGLNAALTEIRKHEDKLALAVEELKDVLCVTRKYKSSLTQGVVEADFSRIENYVRTALAAIKGETKNG